MTESLNVSCIHIHVTKIAKIFILNILFFDYWIILHAFLLPADLIQNQLF